MTAAISSTALTSLNVDTTIGGAYTNAVQLLNTVGVTETATYTDTTMFGDTYIRKDQNIMDANFTAGGFFDYYGDTTGQKLVMDNVVNGAALCFKLSYGYTTYYVKSQVVVTDFTIKTAPKSAVDFNITANSTGTVSRGS
jgi:hypothetical protein